MQSLLSFGKIKMFILEDGKELPYHYNDYFSAEVLKANDDDHQKRVRYNGSCIKRLIINISFAW